MSTETELRHQIAALRADNADLRGKIQQLEEELELADRVSDELEKNRDEWAMRYARLDVAVAQYGLESDAAQQKHR